MALMDGPPPFELVQLSTLPQERWRGLPVFCPACQVGDTPYWTTQDDPFRDPEDEDGARYDVGVVLDWEPDPDFADLGVIRVRFLGDCGSTLRYSSTNLWVPKEALPTGG